jgi:Concanavalin A-like lectin/glucanases superfamily/Animal haem peroxidase
VSEPHLPGSELGELQNAIWTKQFAALRDGDRFFYANDAYLNTVIVGQFGIDYRQTLAQVIENNSNGSVQDDVFKAPVEPGADSTGLVAAYSFDEGTGVNVNDSSGRGEPGVASNTVWTAGKYGTALAFNGFSSKVTIPDNGPIDSTTGTTLEAWIKPSSLGTVWRSVIFKQQPNWLLVALYANDPGGRPYWQISMHGVNDDSVNAIGAPGSIPLNAWTYLAATYDGSVETLYVNGAPVSSTPLAGPLPVANTPLQIGTSMWGEWFRGSIDEVRVYDRALSQSEVQTDMTTPVSAIRLGVAALPEVGEPHVLGGLDSDASGTAEAFPTVASTSGRMENIHVYVDATSAATRLLAGIYADNGGHPGTLLAAGSLTGPAEGTWNTVAVPAVNVAAGTTYWIALMGRGGKLVFRDTCCGGQGTGPSESNATTFLAQLPATWTTGTVFNADAPVSAYGTG